MNGCRALTFGLTTARPYATRSGIVGSGARFWRAQHNRHPRFAPAVYSIEVTNEQGISIFTVPMDLPIIQAQYILIRVPRLGTPASTYRRRTAHIAKQTHQPTLLHLPLRR